MWDRVQAWLATERAIREEVRELLSENYRPAHVRYVDTGLVRMERYANTGR